MEPAALMKRDGQEMLEIDDDGERELQGSRMQMNETELDKGINFDL